MLILNADDVRKALPMREAIEAMKHAFASLTSELVEMPLRTHIPVTEHAGVTLVMPALVKPDQEGEPTALAVKVVSVFDNNADRGLPRIQAAVLEIEAETGRPVALLEGATVTAIRTGAASGAATDLLARKDSRTAAVFGGGIQARTQLEAVCTVRPIETAWVYDTVRENAEALVAEMAGAGPIPGDLRVADTPSEAVRETDVICTATTSHKPVFDHADLEPNAHVNSVGSYQPHVRELPIGTVCSALVVVDERGAALSETGDLIQPIRAGQFSPQDIHAELGEIILGRKEGRTSDDQLTLFKSVGLAVQDAMAARYALRNAEAHQLGQRVTW